MPIWSKYCTTAIIIFTQINCPPCPQTETSKFCSHVFCMSFMYNCESLADAQIFSTIITPSCTLVWAIVLSKHHFYYHITSQRCRDLETDLDSGWIICLNTGISQGAAGWLNMPPELKCCRQSQNPGCSLFGVITDCFL